jgi:hypothetical protein
MFRNAVVLAMTDLLFFCVRQRLSGLPLILVHAESVPVWIDRFKTSRIELLHVSEQLLSTVDGQAN